MHDMFIKDEDDNQSLDESDENECWNQKFCWWNPPKDSIAAGFCLETTIHGFKYIGQNKRHVTERLFWLGAFVLGFTTAAILIHGVWSRYNMFPVIVAFQPYSQDIDTLPFPAVTLCNMNKFPKSKVLELQRVANSPSNAGYDEARKHLSFVRSVCDAQQSFAKGYGFAHTRGQTNYDDSKITGASDDDVMDFILKDDQPCDQLIRLCLLGGEKKNCSDLFKPIPTDYGKCCAFNILPLPLILKPNYNKNPNASIYDSPVLGSQGEKYWPPSEIAEWKTWNYDEGFVLDRNIKKPWKQIRGGLPYGLSVLIDPNTDDYFCPASDSEGVRFILHTALELPHVREFSSASDLNKEVLVEVHPDVTNADDDIRNIEHDKRNCFFGKDYTLSFFGPYTERNCIEECTAFILGDECNCTIFYMQRDEGVRICSANPISEDFRCISRARIELEAKLKSDCGHCETLCEDIAYNYETTVATLQNGHSLWNDFDPEAYPEGESPPWANHKVSIIHIFFGTEATVPKYRKRSYRMADLIANTGGILGLCLGFSILSAVELLYFMTLRAFWKHCRGRRRPKSWGRKASTIGVKIRRVFKSKNETNNVIRIDPNSIPVYPRYGNGVYINGRKVYDGMYNRPGDIRRIEYY